MKAQLYRQAQLWSRPRLAQGQWAQFAGVAGGLSLAATIFFFFFFTEIVGSGGTESAALIVGSGGTAPVPIDFVFFASFFSFLLPVKLEGVSFLYVAQLNRPTIGFFSLPSFALFFDGTWASTGTVEAEANLAPKMFFLGGVAKDVLSVFEAGRLPNNEKKFDDSASAASTETWRGNGFKTKRCPSGLVSPTGMGWPTVKPEESML